MPTTAYESPGAGKIGGMVPEKPDASGNVNFEKQVFTEALLS